MSRRQLDDLDLQIIDRLSTSARVSNRELAREFGLTEGTIRARIKHLTASNTIRVTAVTDIRSLRTPTLAYLFITVEKSSDVQAVADALTAIPEVSFVATLLGRADIMALTLVQSSDELAAFLQSHIHVIPGIDRVQYSLGSRYIKHDHRWCRLTEAATEEE